MRLYLFLLCLLLSFKKVQSADTQFIQQAFLQVSNQPIAIAPGTISTENIEYGTALDYQAQSILFTYASAGFKERYIMQSFLINGSWQKPKRLKLGNNYYRGSDVSISPDGDRLYFKTRYNLSDTSLGSDGNIYVSHRTNGHWSAPELLDKSINSNLDEFYPVETQSGNLYFSREIEHTSYDIFVSQKFDGQLQKAVRLPSNINTSLVESDAFVSADESFMIFVRMYAEDGYGVSDLYISFNQQGIWSGPINMGKKINSPGVDGSPHVSSDNQYLFFTSTRDSDDPTKFDGKLDLYLVKLDLNAYRKLIK